MADHQEFELNYDELVRISNEVNEQVCVPLGHQVAEAAAAAAHDEFETYGDFLHVTTEPRTGADDWAHTNVVAAHRGAIAYEARTGTLTRALGSL